MVSIASYLISLSFNSDILLESELDCHAIHVLWLDRVILSNVHQIHTCKKTERSGMGYSILAVVKV